MTLHYTLHSRDACNACVVATHTTGALTAIHAYAYYDERRAIMTDSTSTMRVRIVQAAGTTLADLFPHARRVPLADPHPEHIGKLGRIVLWERGHSPLIRLDDGTELWGSECWWEPVEPTA